VEDLSVFQILTWRQIDLGGVILAGLAAGYVMAIAGLWTGRIPGLVAVDIADYGRRYMVSDRPSAWLLGFASHLANSILLVFIFASVIKPNLPWVGWLAGIAWGEFLALTLAGSLVTPLSGLGFMGLRAGHRLFHTLIWLHALWGGVVGLIYVAPLS
jgi:hypothetical protein